MGFIDGVRIRMYQLESRGWKLIENRVDGVMYQNRSDKLAAIVSVAKEADGKEWVHLSVSKPSRVPTYDELCKMKELFLGDDLEAYQKFVARKDHINIMPNCLHLWACLEGPQLPDFSNGSGMI